MDDIIFKDRRDAGQQLAATLIKRGYHKEPLVVLGIPRGGVVVAAEVARELSAPLDIIIARKLRAPAQPELGIGAVVSIGHLSTINEGLIRALGVTEDYLERELAAQWTEIERQLALYRGNRQMADIAGKTVIVVDDGIATGYTFRAALEGLQRGKPEKLIATAPVAAADSAEMLETYADKVICLTTPPRFIAVGAWFRNFDQTSDADVADILHHNWRLYETPDG